jgi:hypothetical protein
MNPYKLLVFFALVLFWGCDDDVTEPEFEFAPRDVSVKVKGYFTIDQVFDFINSFDHEVKNINSLVYTSTLPSDSLTYVLNYLNAKTYTNDGNAWFVNGYLRYDTKAIIIFPRLFGMTDRSNQKDWLASIEKLSLSENTAREGAGSIIFFQVPVGKEKEWERKFENYDFVEWAELNYIIQLNPWP